MMKNEKIGFYSQLFLDDEVYFLKDQVRLKDLCIVLKEPLNNSTEVFLTKILAAIGKSLSAATIMDRDAVTDVEQLKTKYVLVFGDENRNDYQVQNLNESKIIYSDSLAKLIDNRDLKTKLWEGLQQIFLN